MFAPAYLDHNATTPLDARVLEAMLPYLKERYGNASSRHDYGRAARAAIDTARQQAAAAVGAHPTEVVFTSGGSEANNLFIKGAAACLKPAGHQPPVVAVSAVEHPCVREPAKELVRQGWLLHEIAVDGQGRIDPDDYAVALARPSRLVSVMLANNETGVLQDVAALAEKARASGGSGGSGGKSGTWFHTDAVQALGKVKLDFRELNSAGVHALTVSAHKIYGPKGAAAIVLDKRVELRPLICGGGQERNLRSGTENVAAIVGFGAACELAVARLAEDAARLQALRARLEEGLAGLGARIFGAGAPRLPNTVFFAMAAIDGETLVAQLDRAGFAVASGSACSSAAPEPSHTLLAMGVEPDLAKSALRVSLGRGNTDDDVERFLRTLGEMVCKLKGLAALAV